VIWIWRYSPIFADAKQNEQTRAAADEEDVNEREIWRFVAVHQFATGLLASRCEFIYDWLLDMSD
jgi:hypothetical protein